MTNPCQALLTPFVLFPNSFPLFQGLCLLDPNPGYCGEEDQNPNSASEISNSNAQWYYYFNAIAGICEQFLFFGCSVESHNNYNRFYSLYQCRSICGQRLEPEINCDKCDVRTSYCKFFSKHNSSCECRYGYTKLSGDEECTDVDECAYDKTKKHQCDENAVCKNKAGSYICECVPGYVGNGKQCTLVGLENCSDCSPNATYIAGKSTCQCKSGFVGDGFNCTDVNECQMSPNVCHQNAKCKNSIGSFSCECRKGFAGNGYSCTKNKLACLDRFDPHYRANCGDEKGWRQHYYLDHETKQCAMFWYNSCPSASTNIFSTLSTCQNMCQHSKLLQKAGQINVWSV
uniref:Uncharacterized protein n=1 Tax=Ditylenchus dipsaci TaxID=166011 RepID=A0A915D9P8_9BILA